MPGNLKMKTGLVAILAAMLLFAGYYYIRSRENKQKQLIHFVFKDLGTLQLQDNVTVNGLVIGKVVKITPLDMKISGMVASVRLNDQYEIPQDSRAFISAPVIGASRIRIEKGVSGSYIRYGDTLKGETDPVESPSKMLRDLLPDTIIIKP